MRDSSSQNSSPRRILVTRDDKLGDVILATPVLESLRKKFPDAYLALLVRPATYDAVRENPFIDEVILDDQPGWGGVRTLAGKIAEKQFDTALILFCSARVSLAAFFAGIPRRIGPRSRWPMIFLTQRIRQNRSQCRKHEADYNLDLATIIGAKPVRNTLIVIDEATQRQVDSLFAKLGIKKDIPLVGIHPGGGGTSRGWKVERYAELIEQLTALSQLQFFVTHGPGEEEKVQRLAKVSPDNTFYHPRDYGILEMAEIIHRCSVFISASTGCSERRWGPYSVLHKLFTPDVPSCDRCGGEDCVYFDCMDGIKIDDVADAVRQFLWQE
jgi:ADP-heptose:LPS heptosyltransferase